MSVKVSGDILIHLKKLTNLDCFSYGQYTMKIEAWKNIETKKGVKEKSILPSYFLPSKPFDDSKINKFRPHSISSNNYQYISQTFMFRSSTEYVS